MTRASVAFESDTDRLNYLKTLGQQITLGGETIWAVFYNGFVSEFESPGISSSEPRLVCRDIDLPSPVITVVAEVNETKYRVAQTEPDGTGLTVLLLKLYG